MAIIINGEPKTIETPINITELYRIIEDLQESQNLLKEHSLDF